ncbi:MAG: hypothetical protein ACN0LA_12155 [Candidatus Longimicrobiales bacterium M2_2A_002]
MRHALALYRRLLRLHAWPLVAIATGVLLFEIFMVWVVAQLDTGQGLAAFIETVLPPQAADMLFEQFGFRSFQGAVAFGFEHPIFLVAVVAFVIVAATTPAAERETGLLDLILARPVSRPAYLLASLLLVLTGAVVLPAAILTGAAIGLGTVETPVPGPVWTAYLPAAAGLGLLLLGLGGISLLAAVSAPRRGWAAGRAVALILVLYWIDFVGPLWSPLEHARWISPFSYFDPSGSVRAGVDPLSGLVLVGVFIATTITAFLEFQRQDL